MIKTSLGKNVRIILQEEEVKQVLKALKKAYRDNQMFDYMAIYNKIKYQTKIEE